jgi:hypothetical protein
MSGRFIALLSSGALALAVSSGSVLASGDDKEQSKLPSSAAVLVVPDSKDLTATSATAATAAPQVAPAEKKKNNK